MLRMTTAALDTLKFANRLKDAGMPSAQAEAEAQALSDALAEQARSLQADMDARFGRDLTQNELRSDAALARLEAKVDKGFAEMNGKFTLLQWMLGFVLALALAIAMKLFLRG